MSIRITVLGAGFGGLELSTLLSESVGDEVQVTLIDKSDAFIFGYSKLDLMFGRATLDSVRLPYRHFVKPGVRLLRETVTAVDPKTRRVTTDAGTHDGDYLVVALGADYDFAATPGSKASTSSTRSPGRAAFARSCPPSRRAAPSSACAGRRTNARRRPASARSCCTTSWRPGACAAGARSRWSCPCRAPCLRRPKPRRP